MEDKVLANEYRKLPSVDELLREDQANNLLSRYPRSAVVDAFREALQRARAAVANGTSAPNRSAILKSAEEILARKVKMSLRPAINATGIIIHTGLGRAVLSKPAVEALVSAASNHSLLEMDVETGKRGSRQKHVESLLTELTGAESALVVNNNAGAVMLVVNSLAFEKEVIISRGQLVEIGGSFRMPDIIQRAGARLVEVGTTNRTRISDYEQALTENTGLILRCHPSNYKITGFVEETPIEALVELGHRAGVPVADDLGSGALIDVTKYGLEYEPTVQDSIKAGADIVTFSGDKLLGASQAGIILGRADLVRTCRSNPLARALRIDKLCLAALEATLRVYRFGDPASEIPVISAISRPLSNIERQARNLARSINGLHIDGLRASVVRVFSQIGGGSLPGQELESRAVALQSDALNAEDLSERFRGYEPPIFGRIVQDAFVLDMRTVTPQETRQILTGVRKLLP
ncbi:MAG: L-seryl-tRNA(Sec) selenium transferase [Armatimonadota bacterium]|nr:L-seryl-tRNA(Sec) selenium transferase [Armatimonadota bacterium]